MKSNIISPTNPDNNLNWSERRGPWGKKIENLLIPPEAGDFITPNKNTFVGQWYWDTMGTNVGLLRSDDDQLKKVAHSMVRNLFMLYEKTGLIPNAADSVQHTRSQPPFLTTMCRDIADNYFNPAESSERDNWYLSAYEYCKGSLNPPGRRIKQIRDFHGLMILQILIQLTQKKKRFPFSDPKVGLISVSCDPLYIKNCLLILKKNLSRASKKPN